MAHSEARVREDFDRIARLSVGHAEDDRYQDWLLRYLPRPCRLALDIGCGMGSLARAIASRAVSVQAIDLSPQMIQVARENCVQNSNIEFSVSEFISMKLPEDRFDCVTAVGVLHHMPWVEVVSRAKTLLRVGGRLLIIDLIRNDGLWDAFLSAVAGGLRLPGRLLRNEPRELRDAWAEHGRNESYLSVSEARRLCREILPGANFRRHLFWRYSIVWTKTAQQALAPDNRVSHACS